MSSYRCTDFGDNVMKFYALVIIAVLTILGLLAVLLVPLIVNQLYPMDNVGMTLDVEHVETLFVPTNEGDIQLDIFYVSTWSRTPYRPRLQFRSSMLVEGNNGQLSENQLYENKTLFADVAQQTHSGLFYQQDFYVLLTSNGRYGIASTCPRTLPNETGLDVWCPESFTLTDAGEYKWESTSGSFKTGEYGSAGIIRDTHVNFSKRYTSVYLGFESLNPEKE